MKFPWIQSLVLSMAVVNGGVAVASQGEAMPDVDGLLTVKSAYSASESVQRIQDALKAKGLTIFTVIDHQKAAEAHQLKMPAASVIVFGNPKIRVVPRPKIRSTPSSEVIAGSKRGPPTTSSGRRCPIASRDPI